MTKINNYLLPKNTLLLTAYTLAFPSSNVYFKKTKTSIQPFLKKKAKPKLHVSLVKHFYRSRKLKVTSRTHSEFQELIVAKISKTFNADSGENQNIEK